MLRPVLEATAPRWVHGAYARCLGLGGARAYADVAVDDNGSRVTGPRHYPSLSQTLRNTRGRELLRIVDTAAPNLKHLREFNIVLKARASEESGMRALFGGCLNEQER